jgi:ABC-type multidrug transport system fused ATPase/permease subunit
MQLIDWNLSNAGINSIEGKAIFKHLLAQMHHFPRSSEFRRLLTREGLLTTVMRVILVCITAKYFAIALPFALASVYVAQRYYLRTSRQLRLLDIEAKAPLYSQFIETLDGLATIRAFGWQHSLQRRNHELLDTSQKPYYLLACIQLWLTFTLDILTAVLAILVVVLAVATRDSATGGDIGVALVNVVSTNQVLAMLLISWTSLETSIGAVSRVRSFARDTPSEVRSDVGPEPSEEWPYAGAISFEDASASYQ